MKRRVGVGDLRIGPRARRYLSQVIKSSRVSYGPFSERFEREFARLHGCRFGVFCNSGTSALHVALQALKEREGWRDGDEVIVPSVTFVATANVVLHNNLTPVFADVDPRTYNIDPAELERRVTARTRAVIPVHLLGLPADMAEIMTIARRRRLKVVEDSCETVFALYRGRVVGSFGDLACFSTYVAHYIVTGVGGLVTTKDAALAERVRSLINHGRVGPRFNFTALGHSFRATEFEAALGMAQLEEHEAIVRKRQRVASLLTKILKPFEDRLQLPYVPPGRDHTFMLYPLVVRGSEKTRLVRHLESKGIETRDLLPLINQPVYRRLFGDLEPEYPVAGRLGAAGFYVGCHQYMTDADVAFIGEQVRRFYAR